MKKIYALVIHYYDEGCGSSREEYLHTTNKKLIEDLAARLNKKGRGYYDFACEEVEVKTSYTAAEIAETLRYLGID